MERDKKNIISLKSVRSSLHPKILIDNTESTNCKFIANAFNDFFANIGQKLASSIPPVNISPMTSMSPMQEDSIYLINDIR